MATCKDCVHVEVCSAYLSEPYKRAHLLAPDPEVIRNLKCDDCENFKNRSQFVELPFAISEGDKLYYIFTDEVGNIRVGDDCETVTRVCKDGFYVSGRLDSDGTYRNGDDFYPWSAIGTEYFLTKEEAEQALTNKNQPDNTPH